MIDIYNFAYFAGLILRCVYLAIIGLLAIYGVITLLMWFGPMSASHTTIGEDIMSDLNSVKLVGNLGGEPADYSSEGRAIVGLSLATKHRWKDGGGRWQNKTEWHRVSAFGKCAQWCIETLHKGARVYVEGRLQTDVVEDKYGQKKYYTKIVAQKIDLE